MQAASAGAQARGVFIAALGAELVSYDFDAASGALTRRGSVRAAAPVQYLWQHRDLSCVYVGSSNGGPDGNGGMARATLDDLHALEAFRLTPAGDLLAHGAPVTLRQRLIHLTLDAESRHVLVVYPRPPAVSVHRIAADGSLGPELAQDAAHDLGVYPHQIRVTPAGRTAIVVARGHHHRDGRADTPGALRVFDYRDGVLTPRTVVAPDGGFGFGPRHIDFHPAGPWLLASLEPQNALVVFPFDGASPAALPVSRVDILRDGGHVHPHQMAGTVHAHPNGRWVYGCNRVNSLDESGVSRPGEDAMVACEFDPATGALRVLQVLDTTGRHPRTFSIDPSGRWLVAANKSPVPQADGSVVPASIDVFAIGADGRLTLAHTLMPEMAAGASMFWAGFVTLPTQLRAHA